jgi:primary-amine oxidase
MPQDRFHEAIVNLSSQTVESNVRLGPNEHGNGDYEEILMVEKNALADEKVKAEIAKLQLPEGTVVCADPWIYGSDVRPSRVIIDTVCSPRRTSSRY